MHNYSTLHSLQTFVYCCAESDRPSLRLRPCPHPVQQCPSLRSQYDPWEPHSRRGTTDVLDRSIRSLMGTVLLFLSEVGGGVKGVNKLNYLYLIKVLLTQLIYSQGYHGCATGKAKQAAKTEIEKLKVRSMGVSTCTVKHALYMYHEVSGVDDFATL